MERVLPKGISLSFVLGFLLSLKPQTLHILDFVTLIQRIERWPQSKERLDLKNPNISLPYSIEYH